MGMFGYYAQTVVISMPILWIFKGGKMKINTDRFVNELNRVFGPPFLPIGFFKASFDGKELRFKIGDRDAEMNSEGEFWASGTNVGFGKRWKIERLKAVMNKRGRQNE
jgi:hypothetical protein